jgi:hypothetical protein
MAEIGGNLIGDLGSFDAAALPAAREALVDPTGKAAGTAAGRLVVNPVEAETVRRIFALYREFGCVRRVKGEADRLGLQTKRRIAANRTERGGKPFSRGHLYKLLSNPIYAGQIAHKGQLFQGQQPALIDDETWTAVRDRLATNAGDHRYKAKSAELSPLAGLLVDARGERLTPSHAVKKGRRYRYYISSALITEAGTDRAQGWRLPAREVEEAVITILIDALSSPARLLDWFGANGMPGDQTRKMLARAARLVASLAGSPEQRSPAIRELVEQVIVDEQTIIIKVRRGPLLDRPTSSASDAPSDGAIELTAAVSIKRRGVGTRLVFLLDAQHNHPARCDLALVKAIARGRAWFEELVTGRARSLQELAKRDGISRRYIRRLVGLAFLSPQLVEAILQGRQPVELTATRLTELDLPLDWAEQDRLLTT